MPPRLFLAAYALSGLAGLVYEVTWTRSFTLVLGHGLAATSTVLAAFMGGLALGAFMAGRAIADLAPRRALLVYAGLELLVVLFALLVPVGLAASSPVFSALYRDGDGGAAFALARLSMCLGLLLPPAMALGATFPVAVRWVAAGAPDPERAAGRLYAVNTLGAAVGAVLAGFVLLPALGVRLTTVVGAAASLAAVACVLTLLNRSREVGDLPRPHGSRVPAPVRRGMRPLSGAKGTVPRPGVAAAVVALTGIATFSAEIAWTRLYALVIGPSTYAFAGTVAAFIGGLGIGAVVGANVGGRARQPAAALALVLAATAAASALTVAAAGTWLPRRAAADFVDASTGGVLLGHAMLLMMLIAPTAIGLGAAFPLALALAGGGAAPARRVGAIYAVNTVASVAGSLATGFVAIPMFGLERTLHLGVVVLTGAAALAAGGTGERWRRALSAPLAAGLVFVWTIGTGGWDRELLASGAYKYAADLAGQRDVETALRAGELLYYKDGAAGTVTVKRLTGQLSLAIDGKIDASTGGDMLTQKLLAHLPLLLHPAPAQVAIVGLGSGVTAAAALTHPIGAVDVLEISPEVVAASRFFTETGSPLDDRRARLLIADGRTHLALAARRYDVIISEPSNPWMAGVATLFTREFFETARARLGPGGLLCQWVNTYDISLDDLRSVVATVASSFPHATLWLIGEGDLLIVASDAAIEPRLSAVPEMWRRSGVADDLRQVGVTEPFQLLSLYLGGDNTISAFAGAAAIQRDDRLALEFSAPRALRSGVRRDNVARLRAAAAGPRPEVIEDAWRSATAGQLEQRARMLMRAGAFADAYDAALAAVAGAPGRADALEALVLAAGAAGRDGEAAAYLTDLAVRQPGESALHVALSRLAGNRGDLDAAAAAAARAVQLAPADPAALEQLASVAADAGDVERLAPIARALAAHPARAGSHYYMAVWHFLRGQLDAAEAGARQAIDRDPTHARAANLLGTIHATRGDDERARQAFAAALAADPQDSTVYQNIGLLELNAGRADIAVRRLTEALTLDPASPSVRDALAKARAALHGF